MDVSGSGIFDEDYVAGFHEESISTSSALALESNSG
jgi:hypothetical protein